MIAINADKFIDRIKKKIEIISGRDTRLIDSMENIGSSVESHVKNRLDETRNKKNYVDRQTGALKRAITHNTYMKGKEIATGIGHIPFMNMMTQGHYSDRGYWQMQEEGWAGGYLIPKIYRDKRIISFYWEKAQMQVYLINKLKRCMTDPTGSAWIAIDKVKHPGLESYPEGRHFFITKLNTLHKIDKDEALKFTNELKKVIEN